MQFFQIVPVENLITDFILAHTSPDGFRLRAGTFPELGRFGNYATLSGGY
ncbi:hypothetical protein SEHO0A_01870 [Salmonella enterica subsp. houtenae str. ATCC BAA-1581]|nr:hypothetical protein SEHO0A_01870 [Salmonella enterica subsp. houtenae str. ATCC BAA-1581]